MKRAGVTRDIAERSLAHAIRGVEDTYDRRLAAPVEPIVRLPAARNVVDMRPRRREQAR
ncbi:MAG TPA: hypothetical protein VGJ20_32265 [Xanthobacteraceae bacterium]|jgi:hypothetical protein